MSYPFATLDVFTGDALSGNPLAVVLDAGDLDDGAMQRIARELNLPETVFVRETAAADERAEIRIFTPVRRLPFATHPTIGTAVGLALHDHGGERGTITVLLREEIGLISCIVDVEGPRRGSARFRAPRLPDSCGDGRREADCARAMGLDAAVIGFAGHRAARLAASMAYDLIPVASLDALAHALPDQSLFDEVFGDSPHPAAYLYARMDARSGLAFRARMFWPGPAGGIAEDPATASAAAALAGALPRSEPLGDGEHRVSIEQGVEMGRPSMITMNLTVLGGKLVGLETCGEAVMVSRGELLL